MVSSSIDLPITDFENGFKNIVDKTNIRIDISDPDIFIDICTEENAKKAEEYKQKVEQFEKKLLESKTGYPI